MPKTVEALLAEIKSLSPPQDFLGGGQLEYERLHPIIIELVVALERTLLHAEDAVVLVREALDLATRYDKMVDAMQTFIFAMQSQP